MGLDCRDLVGWCWGGSRDGFYLADSTKGVYGQPQYWNPLTEDGDALRLAVKLMIHIEWWPAFHDGAVAACTDISKHSEPWRSDRAAATRRAIVRAAAEMAEGQE